MGDRRNLKKCMAVAVLLVVGSWVYVGAAYGQPWDGNGVEGDPYQIWTAEDMQAIGADANYWNAHFLLCADIDLGAYTGTNFNIIGIAWDNPFTGVFDGNGHTISNFTYGPTDANHIVGLFGLVWDEKAKIRDLALVDVNVVGGTDVGSLIGAMGKGIISGCGVLGGRVSGVSSVGGLVGYNYDCVISNCSATTTVCGHLFYSGGLVGTNYHGTISNSYTGGETFGEHYTGGVVGCNVFSEILVCYATGEVSGNDTIGGLAGFNNESEIGQCYSTGKITGVKYVGGLVGWNLSPDEPISDCYATGTVDGNDYVGGLVGYDDGGSYVSCFWDSDINPDLNSIGNLTDPNVVGESTTNMQIASTFVDAGWDFVTPIWKMCNGPDYPKLWWQECPELRIEAKINVVPGTLNLKSKGKWISCYISLPEGYDVGDIKPDSVFLEGGIEAESLQTNGQSATARFSRSEVQKILEVGEIEVTVNGELADGTMFRGTDVIRVMDKGRPQTDKRLIRR